VAQPEGVSLALADGLLEPDPAWTRIDTVLPDVRVAKWSMTTGRQSELERTDTGRASFTVNDVKGYLDHSNPSSPWYSLLDGRQAALALRNPVTDVWHTRFRGAIDDFVSDEDPSQVVTRVDVPLVDAFDYLEAVELVPGIAGFSPPSGVEGNVFYEDAAVDDRILALLGDAAFPIGAFPGGLTRIFSGNVLVAETVYPPGTTALSALRDAADAEFPGVANLFVNCDGIFTFHGRLARFAPEVPDYDIAVWYAGDGAACAADASYAQIRELGWSRPRARIVNLALAYAQTTRPADIPGQVVSDLGSVGLYGPRAWSADNLLTEHDNLMDLGADAATKLFAEYMVANFAEPRSTVDKIVVKSLRPDDARGPATWALLCGVQISDIVHLKSTNPGGGGFDEDFYVEGMTYDVEPLDPDYDLVTLTLSVSPRAYYADNPFTS
jgi:hypothetical protein